MTTLSKVEQVDLAGVGLNATDTLIPVAHYPARGTKVEIRPTTILPGGQTATAVVACQQWGLRTRYVGKVGGDSAAALHAAEFSRVGVEAHLLTAPDCPSQQAFILVDDSGERTVLWRRDHRLALRPEELQRDWVVNARALHLDGHDTAAAAQAAAWARASPCCPATTRSTWRCTPSVRAAASASPRTCCRAPSPRCGTRRQRKRSRVASARSSLAKARR